MVHCTPHACFGVASPDRTFLHATLAKATPHRDPRTSRIFANHTHHHPRLRLLALVVIAQLNRSYTLTFLIQTTHFVSLDL